MTLIQRIRDQIGRVENLVFVGDFSEYEMVKATVIKARKDAVPSAKGPRCNDPS